jgi:hypothetical protein
VSSDHGPEIWHAVSSIVEDPEPEVGALARSAQGAPSTPEEAKIQQNDCIGGAQPDLDTIMQAKIAVERVDFPAAPRPRTTTRFMLT